MATALVLVLVLFLATGCSNRPPSAPAPTTVRGPDDIDQTTSRWIDNPAIDLMSPEGTFVRATVESLVRASYGRGRGTQADRRRRLPGTDSCTGC